MSDHAGAAGIRSAARQVWRGGGRPDIIPYVRVISYIEPLHARCGGPPGGRLGNRGRGGQDRAGLGGRMGRLPRGGTAGGPGVGLHDRRRAGGARHAARDRGDERPGRGGGGAQGRGRGDRARRLAQGLRRTVGRPPPARRGLVDRPRARIPDVRSPGRRRGHRSGRTPPPGYRLRAWSRAGVTRVLVTASDGSWAARGQIATTGATAVVDQVETSPGHRRRGLGRTVMRSLARRRRSRARRPPSSREHRRDGRSTRHWAGAWRHRC